MPKPATLTKAELVEMDSELKEPKPGVKPVRVQFNPETLKVTYSNQVATEANKPAQKGTLALQHVNAGTTKLTVQLWFDVNHPEAVDAPKNVRELTGQVAYFITPQKESGESEKYTIPGLRFSWGTFSFVGVMESLDETLELFSADGNPLRASLSLGLTQQEIKAFDKTQGMRQPKPKSGTGQPVGTARLTPATQGSSVQSLADGISGGARGGSKNWQDIAAANGIENPRLLAPGQLIDINAKVRPGF
jgi:hypothetical protein